MSCFWWLLGAVRRLIRGRALSLILALAVCGLTWVSDARANPPQVMYHMTSYFTKWWPTKAEACTDGAKVYGGPTAVGTVRSGEIYCDVGYPGGSQVGAFPFITNNALCSDGTAPNTALPLNEQCRVPGPDCSLTSTKNLYLGAGAQGTGVTLPSTICIQGCTYNTGSVGVQAGTSYSTDIGAGTGGTCNAANYDTIDTTTKKTDPPSLRSCALQGKVYGTVNGVGICAAAGTIPNSTVTQNGSTTNQNTSASGVQAPPTTSTTTTTVSNVNNVSTVTTTTTNPDGSKTQTTEDQGTYCQKNPSAQVCKESEGNASGGADCTAPPSCSGDAIQCMMVNQQWRTRCDSNQPNSLSDLGNQILAGNDPVSNPAAQGNRTVSNISSSIDQSTFLQGGGGLADKMVTVGGRVIALPFSKLNQYLVWLGHIFVVISLIGGLRIVLGGFKK